MTERNFVLGGHDVGLLVTAPGRYSGEVDGQHFSGRYGGWREIRAELDARAVLFFEFAGRDGRIDYVGGHPRRVRVSHDGTVWTAAVRVSGGLQLHRQNGSWSAVLSPWKMRLSDDALTSDVAIALTLVLHELDVGLGPPWLLFATALALPIGWPEPFPRRGWRRR